MISIGVLWISPSHANHNSYVQLSTECVLMLPYSQRVEIKVKTV